jgi:hypothetical protein
MELKRRFCRFTRGDDAWSIHEIPPDGFCLSAFLLLSPPGTPDRVLMGRINPEAGWGPIGGLSSERVEAHRNGWMLPSSQLLFGESPDAAARRLLQDQLPGLSAVLAPPIVTSEVYAPKRFPNEGSHWDIGFLYRGRLESDELPVIDCWSALALLDARVIPRARFARSHDDVLELAGYAVSSEA